MPERHRASLSCPSYRVLFVAVALLLLCLALPQTARSAQAGGKIHAVIRGGIASVSMEDTKTTFDIGGGVEYRAGGKLGLGLFYDYTSFEAPDPFLSPADLTLHAFTGAASYYFKPDGKYNPYVTGGVVFFGSSIDDTGTGSVQNIGFETGKSADAGTGFSVGGGTEIAMGEKGALDVNLRYIMSDLDASLTITDVVTGLGSSTQDTLDLNVFLVTVGYRFSF